LSLGDADADADVLIAVDLRFMCKKEDHFRSSHHVQILKFQSYQMLVRFHNPEFIRGVACPRPAGAWEGEEQDCVHSRRPCGVTKSRALLQKERFVLCVG
jgi:hypothetical protein